VLHVGEPAWLRTATAEWSRPAPRTMRTGTPSSRERRPRAKPRAQDELLEWLRGRSTTSIHALRRHRFTLRMVASAERDGLVAVDHDTGQVAVR
jgi:hypothetical protein